MALLGALKDSKYMKLRLMTYMAAIALMAAACNDDEDFVAPSFIHVDAMKLVMPANNVISTEAGFYTSEVTSCNVEALYKGSNKVESIGHFELPFTAPLLFDGEVEYLIFSPAVKVSGISGMQVYYTFYQRDTVRNAMLRSGDTLWLDTLTFTYDNSVSGFRVHLFEPFEPTEASILLDSVDWHRHSPDEACNGEGYGSVFVPDTMPSVPFSIKNIIKVNNSSHLVYLELDHRSDVDFEVYMHSRYVAGGNENVEQVMVVRASSKWQHMYITLGRTWEWFHYYPEFRLSFRALNADGISGYVRLDNVRVLSTSKTL